MEGDPVPTREQLIAALESRKVLAQNARDIATAAMFVAIFSLAVSLFVAMMVAFS